jgi:hypothetical protein
LGIRSTPGDDGLYTPRDGPVARSSSSARTANGGALRRIATVRRLRPRDGMVAMAQPVAAGEIVSAAEIKTKG